MKNLMDINNSTRVITLHGSNMIKIWNAPAVLAIFLFLINEERKLAKVSFESTRSVLITLGRSPYVERSKETQGEITRWTGRKSGRTASRARSGADEMQQKARWGHVGSGFGMELETKGLRRNRRGVLGCQAHGIHVLMQVRWRYTPTGAAGGVGQSVTQSQSASRSRLRGAIAWAICFFFFFFLISSYSVRCFNLVTRGPELGGTRLRLPLTGLFCWSKLNALCRVIFKGLLRRKE